ncbi:glycosyltransferase family 9 protein [Nitrospira sp. Nam74]
MPAWSRMTAEDRPNRALVVQLARLGDLVQSLPAITALRRRRPSAEMDLLCAASLAAIGSCVPGIARVLPWEVERWRAWADGWSTAQQATLTDIEAYLKMIMSKPYGKAFNLNQHSRAILAASLFGERVVGPGEQGPLSTELPPWADYLRGVARAREHNRVHLADMFCGMCGVTPPGEAPKLEIPAIDLPEDLASVGESDGPWIAIVVGAGDAARCIPPVVWRDWIRVFLAASPAGQVVLIGSGVDRERANAIQDGLSSLHLGRVWDSSGRTTIVQTAAILARCQWVVGSDTGPLHVGTAVGARAMGFYFARARVHETGPYGQGHWTWQAEPPIESEIRSKAYAQEIRVEEIHQWPIAQSIQLILNEPLKACEGWTLWSSRLDEWGVRHVAEGNATDFGERREDVWRRLHRPMPSKAHSHEYV